MSRVSAWAKRRKWTLGLAVFLLSWHLLQLAVLSLFGEAFARYLFYLEQPPNHWSPGTFVAPISHSLYTLTHVTANVLLLIIAGGVSEPYIGRDRVLIHAVGMSFLVVLFANMTSTIHHQWVVAGASGGVLSLWAYAAFRTRHLVVEFFNHGLNRDAKSVEGLGAALLLGETPIYFFVETIFGLHAGHALGLIFDGLYFVLELILDPPERSAERVIQ